MFTKIVILAIAALSADAMRLEPTKDKANEKKEGVGASLTT